MAANTLNKRASAVGISLPWRGRYPTPDGAIGQADRQQACLLYAGLLLTVPAAPIVVVPVPPPATVSVTSRDVWPVSPQLGVAWRAYHATASLPETNAKLAARTRFRAALGHVARGRIRLLFRPGAVVDYYDHGAVLRAADEELLLEGVL